MPPKAAGIVEPVPVRGEVIAYAEMGSTIYKRPGVLGGEVHVHADDEIEVPESIYNEFLKGYMQRNINLEQVSKSQKYVILYDVLIPGMMLLLFFQMLK